MRFFVFVVALVLLAGASALAAEKRVALVIGNGGYLGDNRLANPPTDAKRIAEMLRRDLGFEVPPPVLDGKLADMDTALDRFKQSALGAEVALFFYAGHGMEMNGQNMLVPVDAHLANERDVPRQTLPLDLVMDAMSGARVKVALLDACRNNPMAQRMLRLNGARGSGSRGLSPMLNAGEGTVIAFATAPGTTAADGDAADSPFTTALLQMLPTLSHDIRIVLGDVSEAVRRATNGEQSPWTNFNLSGEVVLKVSPATASSVAPPEVVFWQSIAGSSNPAEFEAYLRQYPQGSFVSLARTRLAALSSARPAPLAAPVPASPAPAPSAGSVLRDCPDCPEMVLIPSGSFLMGVPEAESQREGPGAVRHDVDARPLHSVRIGEAFYLGRYHVTRGQYGAFAAATARPDGGACWTFDSGSWVEKSGQNWRNPGFQQTDRDPVVCVTWDDAVAYTEWLSRRAGKRYRLPTEAEWEYAARAGTRTARYWAESSDQQCQFANGADLTARETVPGSSRGPVASCRDGFAYTSPVGSFRPNGFGLYDILGNAWQWVQDCYAGNYNSAPRDVSLYETNFCSPRVLRGGAWGSSPRNLRAGNRSRYDPGHRYNDFGFRVARTLTP